MKLRVVKNILEANDRIALSKWSCPALPYAMYMGKTHSYKSYTTNFS